MYICSECGNEYKEKPKYCDCGNDIFINTEEENNDELDFEIETDEPREIEEDFETDEATVQRHRNFRKRTSSPVGLAVFILCLILSLLVLFVIGNPKKDKSVEEISKEIQEKIEIPSIDSYWDNTPVKIAQKEKIPTEQKEENILDKFVQQIIPQEPPKKIIPPAVTITKTAPKTSQNQKTQIKTKPITSSAVSPKKTTSTKAATQKASQGTGMTFEDLTNKIRTQYNNQPTQQTPTTKTQTVAKTQTSSNTTYSTTNSAPLPTQTTTAQTTSQIPKIHRSTSQIATTHTPSTQTQTVQTPPAKSQAQLRQELNSYKSSLRNTIGRKIDFTRVIGDGECSLSFKINSNGRLTSKAFTKQSSNITLNDAAFNALNTTTSFSAPPEGYKGETLRLTIKFYNGNFEISLN
ncbi:TonB C-terminal domain-containing protein [bacterium]|nr:TonB C-terminal domain-containing protein [bacterium]